MICSRKPLEVSGVGWGGAQRRGPDNLGHVTAFLLQEIFLTLAAYAAAVSIQLRCSGLTSHCLSPHWSLKSERARMAVHNFSKLSWGCGGRGVLSPPEQSQRHWAHTVQVSSWSVWRRQWSAIVRTFVISPFLCACHCLCEAVAFNGWTWGKICEVRKQQLLFSVRGNPEDYWGAQIRNWGKGSVFDICKRQWHL